MKTTLRNGWSWWVLLCLTPLLAWSQGSPNGQLILQSQFINPCGLDGNNEFILLSTGNASVHINDMAFASIDPMSGVQPNLNFYWSGKNVVADPNPTFTLNTDACGSGALKCYGIADPNIPAEASVIDSRINALNLAAGCPVFLAVPASGEIPANSNILFFLGAYNCDFSNLATNLNFSNHCSGGTPTSTYYAVFGLGDGGTGSSLPCTNPTGYFSNTETRTSVSYVFTGGTSTNPANYVTNAVTYTPGAPPSSGNAGIIDPNGTWINNQSCIPTNATLPIQLLSFTGKATAHSVELHWQTALETNNAYILVERSRNSADFQAIGKLLGYGNSQQPRSYHFTDRAPQVGVNYYRLKQVDWDDTETYHSTIAVDFLGTHTPAGAHLYPAAAHDQLTLAFDHTLQTEGSVTILDLAGKMMQQQPLHKGTQQTTLSISALSAGSYYIKIYHKNRLETLRFVKL